MNEAKGEAAAHEGLDARILRAGAALGLLMTPFAVFAVGLFVGMVSTEPVVPAVTIGLCLALALGVWTSRDSGPDAVWAGIVAAVSAAVALAAVGGASWPAVQATSGVSADPSVDMVQVLVGTEPSTIAVWSAFLGGMGGLVIGLQAATRADPARIRRIASASGLFATGLSLLGYAVLVGRGPIPSAGGAWIGLATGIALGFASDVRKG